MKVFVIVASVMLCSSAVIAAPSINDNKIESDHTPSTFSRAARFLGSCFESDEMATCLAMKGIIALNRAARSNDIELTSGVTFTRNPESSVSESGRSLTEHDVIAELSADSEDKTGNLLELGMKATANFLKSHNMVIKVPTEEVARAFAEGRTKLKKSKLLSPLVLAIGTKIVALLPLFLGGLALLAFKAVLVAKTAFLLALSLGAGRFFGFGPSGSKIGQAVVPVQYSPTNINWGQGGVGQGYAASSASASYPNARSGYEAGDAQDLAYAGQNRH